MDRIRAQIQNLDIELAGARELGTELTWLEKYAHMIPDIATLVFEELDGCNGEQQKRIITSLLSKAVVKVYDPRTIKVEGVINYQAALVVLAEISKERDKILGMIEDMQKKLARDRERSVFLNSTPSMVGLPRW